MQEETKRKFALWIKPSTLTLVDKHYKHDNCGCRSDYIDKAIHFYSGYLSEKDSGKFLSKSLVSTLRGMHTDTENRVATLLFKFTVELAILMHVVASMAEVDDETLRRLRAKCVEDAKRTNGIIDFSKIVRYQNRRD